MHVDRISAPAQPVRRPPLLRGPEAERIVLATELDPWLPLRALATYSGLSVRTLRDYINDPLRALPCYRVGAKILVRRSEFDAWVQPYRQVGLAGAERIADEVLGPSKARRR